MDADIQALKGRVSHQGFTLTLQLNLILKLRPLVLRSRRALSLGSVSAPSPVANVSPLLGRQENTETEVNQERKTPKHYFTASFLSGVSDRLPQSPRGYHNERFEA